MKIVTVNIPESYLESIERLIGENGLYPSRSELIRCAVREFLIKELRRANEMIKYKEVEIEKLDDKNFVRVPVEKMDELCKRKRHPMSYYNAKWYEEKKKK